MTQINSAHLAFLQEAKEAFQNNKQLETYRNFQDPLIALRMGMDRDCIEIHELGNFIANFVQQMEPAPYPRKTVKNFAHDMEKQLNANDHKGGWEEEHWSDLAFWIEKSLDLLRAELVKSLHDNRNKHEIAKRCANIANFAMMIADNEGEPL